MKYVLFFMIFSMKALCFSTYSSSVFTSKWSFITDEILSLKKVNPLYFRDRSVENQLDLDSWTNRLRDLELGAQVDITRKDYFKKKLVVGKIIASVGDIRVSREGGKVVGDVKFLYQGDVVETKISGSCWIVLLDGSIFRLSPESSVSISEIMFNSKKFHAFIRVNKGEVITLNRTNSDSFLDNGRFLDLSFLSIFEASLVEKVLSYFGETLYTNKKISFEKIVKLFRLYTNDTRFENWGLKASYSFYNENMFVTLRDSLSHFFVDDSSSYIKVIPIFDSPEAGLSFTEVNYSGETSELITNEWLKFNNGAPSKSNYMADKEYPIKMFMSNVVPFYLLRENFMNNYSYYVNNVNSFPTIKNFSNFKGKNLDDRKKFISSYFKKAETTFRGVKRSYVSPKSKILSSAEYRDKFHKTGLRLVTLRGLNILNPDEIFNKNRLLYSGLMEYREEAQQTIKKLLKKAVLSGKNTEYLSRQ